MQLDDGLELSFTDKRRFAKVRLLKDVLWLYLPIAIHFYFSNKEICYWLYIFSSDVADISATHISAWSWCSFWTNDTWEVYGVFAQEENWNQGFITWSSIKLFFYYFPYIVFHSSFNLFIIWIYRSFVLSFFIYFYIRRGYNYGCLYFV